MPVDPNDELSRLLEIYQDIKLLHNRVLSNSGYQFTSFDMELFNVWKNNRKVILLMDDDNEVEEILSIYSALEQASQNRVIQIGVDVGNAATSTVSDMTGYLMRNKIKTAANVSSLVTATVFSGGAGALVFIGGKVFSKGLKHGKNLVKFRGLHGKQEKSLQAICNILSNFQDKKNQHHDIQAFITQLLRGIDSAAADGLINDMPPEIQSKFAELYNAAQRNELAEVMQIISSIQQSNDTSVIIVYNKLITQKDENFVKQYTDGVSFEALIVDVLTNGSLEEKSMLSEEMETYSKVSEEHFRHKESTSVNKSFTRSLQQAKSSNKLLPGERNFTKLRTIAQKLHQDHKNISKLQDEHLQAADALTEFRADILYATSKQMAGSTMITNLKNTINGFPFNNANLATSQKIKMYGKHAYTMPKVQLALEIVCSAALDKAKSQVVDNQAGKSKNNSVKSTKNSTSHTSANSNTLDTLIKRKDAGLSKAGDWVERTVTDDLLDEAREFLYENLGQQAAENLFSNISSIAGEGGDGLSAIIGYAEKGALKVSSLWDMKKIKKMKAKNPESYSDDELVATLIRVSGQIKENTSMKVYQEQVEGLYKCALMMERLCEEYDLSTTSPKRKSEIEALVKMEYHQYTVHLGLAKESVGLLPYYQLLANELDRRIDATVEEHLERRAEVFYQGKASMNTYRELYRQNINLSRHSSIESLFAAATATGDPGYTFLIQACNTQQPKKVLTCLNGAHAIQKRDEFVDDLAEVILTKSSQIYDQGEFPLAESKLSLLQNSIAEYQGINLTQKQKQRCFDSIMSNIIELQKLGNPKVFGVFSDKRVASQINLYKKTAGFRLRQRNKSSAQSQHSSHSHMFNSFIRKTPKLKTITKTIISLTPKKSGIAMVNSKKKHSPKSKRR